MNPDEVRKNDAERDRLLALNKTVVMLPPPNPLLPVEIKGVIEGLQRTISGLQKQIIDQYNDLNEKLRRADQAYANANLQVGELRKALEKIRHYEFDGDSMSQAGIMADQALKGEGAERRDRLCLVCKDAPVTAPESVCGPCEAKRNPSGKPKSCSRLEGEIMAVLAKERKTAQHVIADAHEISGFLELRVGELTGERDRLKKCLEEVWLGMDEFLGVLRGVIPQASLDMWEAACRKMRAYTEKPKCVHAHKKMDPMGFMCADCGEPVAEKRVDDPKCPECGVSFGYGGVHTH